MLLCKRASNTFSIQAYKLTTHYKDVPHVIVFILIRQDIGRYLFIVYLNNLTVFLQE